MARRRTISLNDSIAREFLRNLLLGDWEDKRQVALTKGKELVKTVNGTKTYHRNLKVKPTRKITGLVLHCTAHHGRRNVDDWVKHIGAHFVITATGQIIVHYDEEVSRQSSNDLNKKTVAVEFVGNFRNKKGKYRAIGESVRKTPPKAGKKVVKNGIEEVWVDYEDPDNPGKNVRRKKERRISHVDGGKRVFSRPDDPDHQHHDELTKAQIDAGRRLVMYLKAAIGIKEIWAHCQSTVADKPNCPGPDVWYYIGEWAKNNAGLKIGNDGKKIGRGRYDIPTEWKNPLLLSDDQIKALRQAFDPYIPDMPDFPGL